MEATKFKEILSRAYGSMLAKAISILQDEDRAKDVVQEVAVKLWERPEGLERAERPLLYCLMAVRNEALMSIRGEKPKVQIEDAHQEIGKYSDALEYEDIMKLMERLPEKQRQVFRMVHIDGYDYGEIEERLGMTQANIRQLLSRARKGLRELYGERGLK